MERPVQEFLNGTKITIEGPFAFHIELDAGVYFLKLDGGEWRVNGLWVAQGKINRFEALARTLRKIEKQQS
jgi:hypothetical protein